MVALRLCLGGGLSILWIFFYMSLQESEITNNKFYVKFADRGKANAGLYSDIWRLQIESTPVTSRSNSRLSLIDS